MCCALACGKDERFSIGRYFSSSMMQKRKLNHGHLECRQCFWKICCDFVQVLNVKCEKLLSVIVERFDNVEIVSTGPIVCVLLRIWSGSSPCMACDWISLLYDTQQLTTTFRHEQLQTINDHTYIITSWH